MRVAQVERARAEAAVAARSVAMSIASREMEVATEVAAAEAGAVRLKVSRVLESM